MLFHNIWFAKFYLFVTRNWLWVFNMASSSFVMFSYFPQLNKSDCFITFCWVGNFWATIKYLIDLQISHRIQQSIVNIIWRIKSSIPLSNSSSSSYLQLNDKTHVELMKMLFNGPATFSRQHQCS